MKQTKEWKVYLVESLGYTAFYGTGPICLLTISEYMIYACCLPRKSKRFMMPSFFHYKIQHATFGIVYQFHRLSQKPSKIRNFTLGELHTAFLS